MKSAAEQAREVESNFLAGVQANLKDAGSRLIAGSWFKREDFDDAERLRAAMVDRRLFERELFAELPHGRGFVVRGFERRWIFGKRLRSVTIAGVLAPPGPLLDAGNVLPPVTMAQLAEYVRGVVKDDRAPHLLGVCSPSGFAEEVWTLPPELPNVKLVLIEPREDGGWRVGSTDEKLDARLCKLFDPEQIGQKLERVRREIEDRSPDLLTGGLTASDLARQLELPPPLVQQAFERAAKENPELRVSKRAGEMMLFRGAPVLSDEEDGSMSLAGWIKSLFSREGEEAKKINVLSERRASLSGRLDRMYEDISKLENREEELREEGKASSSMIAKRRMAAQISRLRKDISRCNTSAAMLSKQINIISTHIHNLELARTGSVAQMPTSEELTEAAVNAEEIIEQLAASDDLVSGLEVNMAESAMSDEEAAILAELQGDDEKAAPPKGKEASGDASRTTEAERKQRGPAQAE